MISILICSKYTNQFLKCSRSISDAATSNNYEIIVKVDSLKEKQHRSSILGRMNVKFVVVCNGVTGYENLHIMTNQMAEIAKGDLLWCMADDCHVVGDWYGAFREVQRKNPDNIFVINTRKNDSWAVCPVVSRGWYETLGYIAASPTNDFFLKSAGDRSGRYFSLPQSSNLRIIHEQRSAGISKRIRKPGMKLAARRSKGAARLIRLAVQKFYAK